jgi:hypothetical protein
MSKRYLSLGCGVGLVFGLMVSVSFSGCGGSGETSDESEALRAAAAARHCDQVRTSTGSHANGKKTTICHIPPGNPANAHTITVGNPAVPAHLAHGDHIGACVCTVGQDGGTAGGGGSADSGTAGGGSDDSGTAGGGGSADSGTGGGVASPDAGTTTEGSPDSGAASAPDSGFDPGGL